MALGSHLITVRRLKKYIDDVIGKKANLPDTSKTIIGNIAQINTDLSDQPVLLATIPQGTTYGAEFTTNDNISKYKYMLLIGNESLANGTSIIPTNAFVGGFKVGLNNYYGGKTYRLMMEYVNDTKVKAFRADSLLTGNCALYGIKC